MLRAASIDKYCRGEVESEVCHEADGYNRPRGEYVGWNANDIGKAVKLAVDEEAKSA